VKIAAILVSVAAAISAGAISEESKTIEGQVFIVTGAHESIKLGLVAVAAFNPEEFARSISALQPVLEAERQELDGLKPSVQRLTSKLRLYVMPRGDNTRKRLALRMHLWPRLGPSYLLGHL